MVQENQSSTGETTSTAPPRPAHGKAHVITAPRFIPAHLNNGIEEWEIELKQGVQQFTLRAKSAEAAKKAAEPYLEGNKKYDTGN